MANLFLIETKKWRKKGHSIVDEMEAYEWKYREKICLKCSIKKQKELKCFKVNNFVNEIQETYCSKLENTRTQKFSKKIDMFFDCYPLG